ncbi:uncharacterized protein LOC134740994 [Cydia strobilella]|uniref:uncharacterized protein LOC134740994 n=1 Tax=Cydia strobilella TaxID=1100964 RepID=UPI00300784D6
MITDENKRFLIIGDHNVDYLTDNTMKRRINDVLTSYGCQNIISFATRVTADCASSIDCGISNCASDELSVTPVDTAISDHNAQRFELITQHKLDNKEHRVVERRVFDIDSIGLFYRDIANYNFNFIYDNTFDINYKFNKLFNIFKHYIDIHFPIKKFSCKNIPKVPWLSDELAELIGKHVDLHEIRRQYPNNPILTECIDHYSSLIKTKTLQTRQKFIEGRLMDSGNKSKEIWKIVNEEVGTKSKSQNISLRDPLTSLTIEKRDLPNTFNSHFLSIASKYAIQGDLSESIRYLQTHLGMTDVPIFTLPVVTRDLLDKALHSMMKKRSTVDAFDISPNILFWTWPVVGDVLVVLINLMFETGTYPDVLKNARVCPVFKGKGDRCDVNNYRPITIVPTISKMVESILS